MTRCGMPSGPCQLAGSLNQTKRWWSPLMRTSSCDAPPSDPRGEQPLDLHQQHVEHDREHDGEHCADEQWRVEEAVEPVVDERAEATLVGTEDARDRYE